MIFKNQIENIDTKEIVYSKFVNWNYFKNATVMITGATGLIGFQTVLSFLYANEMLDTNIKILALVRNKNKAEKMFARFPSKKLKIIVQDILKPIKIKEKVDYIIHTANTTSSKEMTVHPVETVDSIVLGTKNILEFAKLNKVKSVVYLSSMEVFGEIPLDRVEPLNEVDLGKVDLTKPRSSYPMGKRLAECICSSYAKEYSTPVKVARLAQTIGAGVDYNDNRVFSQFARNIIEKKDIVLKTEGKSIRSYIYITDCISAILNMLEFGVDGEIYNIANPDTTCSIKDMARMLCDKHPDSKLKFELDNKFYPNDTKLFLSIDKFTSVSSWRPVVALDEMYSRLITCFYFQKEDKVFDNQEYKISFLEKIFSVRNYDKIKVVNIFGFKVEFDRTKIYSYLYSHLPIKRNKIIFYGMGGGKYGCNPKYIAEEILKRKLNVELVWICKDKNLVKKYNLPKEFKITGFANKKSLKEMFTSKVIITNARFTPFIKKGWNKRKEQKYIETWHGSLGIKKIGESVSKDNLIVTEKSLLDLQNYEIGMIDYLISNSVFEDNVYKEAFKWKKDTLKFGHPRNDVFFYSQEKLNNIRNKIYSFYNIPKNKKIVLYAPSYRDDMRMGVSAIDYSSLSLELKNKFGGDWVVLLRLHPRFANSKYLKADNNNIVDVTMYPDMQELLVTADVGITDYSSWMFDYMLSKKPVFIYAEDIEQYNTERGFYYPLEETPFSIARNNEELSKNIQNFDNEKYIIKVDKFLKDKGCMEDGHASERVVDLIEEILKNDLK